MNWTAAKPPADGAPDGHAPAAAGTAPESDAPAESAEPQEFQENEEQS